MFKNLLVMAVSLVFLGLSVNAQATTLNFDFTGECDDCAFNGDPLDFDFNPFDDGLTQTVTASLRFDGVVIENGIIQSAESLLFQYDGSSLINPFAFDDVFLNNGSLLATGEVRPGFQFALSSSSNANSPNPFDFPNFCTPQGELVLDASGGGACGSVGLVDFLLDSDGNFSIAGSIAFDVGFNGVLTPAAAVPLPAAFWFFGTGLIGLFGFARKKA